MVYVEPCRHYVENIPGETYVEELPGWVDVEITEDPLAQRIFNADDWPTVMWGPDYIASKSINDVSLRVRLCARAIVHKYAGNKYTPHTVKVIRLQHEEIPRVRVEFVVRRENRREGW